MGFMGSWVMAWHGTAWHGRVGSRWIGELATESEAGRGETRRCGWPAGLDLSGSMA